MEGAVPKTTEPFKIVLFMFLNVYFDHVLMRRAVTKQILLTVCDKRTMTKLPVIFMFIILKHNIMFFIQIVFFPDKSILRTIHVAREKKHSAVETL